MFQLHVVLDQARGWLDYVAPFSTLLTAIAAIGTVSVALRIANNQNKLQKTLARDQSRLQEALAEKQLEIQKMQLERQAQQLKKDLFDRRFGVFTGVLTFITYVPQENGDIELHGPGQYRQFRECMETAEMLFGDDVNRYLEDVDETARQFYVSARRREIDRGDPDAIEKDGQLLNRLSVTLLQRRKGLFRRYLTLWLFHDHTCQLYGESREILALTHSKRFNSRCRYLKHLHPASFTAW
jgi:hypothetical protein